METWRRWLIGGLLAGMAGLPAVPARAAGATLILIGKRSASVDVTLNADVTLDLQQMVTTGAGRFAGMYAEAISVPVPQRQAADRHGGAVRFRDVHEPGSPGFLFSFVARPSGILKAGRYRLYLLADGPTQVRVPITGSRSLRVSPTRPAVTAVASAADILVSAIEARNVQPLVLSGPRTVNMSALLVGEFRAFAGDIGTCLRRPETECGSATGSGVDGPFASVGINPVGDYGLAWSVTYQPGTLAPGRYEGVQEALNVAGLKYASGASLSLTLT